MKKFIYLFIVLVSLSACSTQKELKGIETQTNIQNNENFQDITELKWSCAHGAYTEEIEIKGDYLIEHSHQDKVLSSAYKIKHLKDNIFELSQANTDEIKELKHSKLIKEINPEAAQYTHLKVRENKDIDLAIISDENPLDTLSKEDIGHACELVENIQ